MKRKDLIIALSISMFIFVLSFDVREKPRLINSEDVSLGSQISFANFMLSQEPDEPEDQIFEITLTRFYPSDSTGSDTCMATMCLSNKKIKVNEKGWYTYDGKVIIAAATNACRLRCKNRSKYGDFPSDFRIYDYYDEILFRVEGVTYTGIILDSCGACMWHINGEKNQRYDIFTVDGSSSSSLLTTGNIGKTKAELLVPQENK